METKSSDRRYSFRGLQPLLITVLSASAFLPFEGCMVGPKYQPLKIQAPALYKEQAQQSEDGTLWSGATPKDTELRGKWWEIYQDPDLNKLEEKLDLENQNIAQAYHNYMEARALVDQAKSSLKPTITTAPSYTRVRSSENQSSLLQSTHANPNSNTFQLPLDISWEPDLWGRIHNTIRAQNSAAQASVADLANIKLSEEASLAIYYFELRGQDSLQLLYNRSVEAYRGNLEVTQTLLRTGVGTDEAVAQAELNLKSAQSKSLNLGIARAQYEHAIAVLVGGAASSFSIPDRPFAFMLPKIPVGVPSDLLQRRPDIAAAERTMERANALIGVQTAAFYPAITIGGTGGFESTKVGNWLSWPSRFFSIGPTATQTLFDGGARRASLAQYKAEYDADAASYRQTVLTAFQQTEDYLAAQRILAEQIPMQEEAVAAASRYLDIAQLRYRTGVDSYLNVYTAQASLLTEQQTAVGLQIQQITNSVQLIKALGGGWKIGQLP